MEEGGEVKNTKFYWLLHERKAPDRRPQWTVTRLAGAIGANRAHVNDVLNNKPGHGCRTRPKLVALFRLEFPNWEQVLKSLDWPIPTFHVEQRGQNSRT